MKIRYMLDTNKDIKEVRSLMATKTTPTLQDVKEFQETLLQMDKKTFNLYKQLAYVLITKMPQSNEKDDDSQLMDRQRQFIKETAGKMQVDEDAVNDIRMRSMI